VDDEQVKGGVEASMGKGNFPSIFVGLGTSCGAPRGRARARLRRTWTMKQHFVVRHGLSFSWGGKYVRETQALVCEGG